jgi:hypothetical protein
MQQLKTAVISIAIILVLCAFVKYLFIFFMIIGGEPKGLEGFRQMLWPNDYPDSQTFPLLKGVYPLRESTVISNNNADFVGLHNAPTDLSSFAQITNNIRYNNNPDNGTCTPAQFCGSLYKSYQNKVNTSVPLNPVPYGPGARVNFVRSKNNLLQFNFKENVMY